MRSIRNIESFPAGRTLLADDLVEFHASRILLLIGFCGTSRKIDGLTKLAKLDFFVRYPEFFERVADRLGSSAKAKTKYVEASMVRHHYGPWDKRYYQVLSYLESRELITITKGDHNSFVFYLTDEGERVKKLLAKDKNFENLIDQMKSVKQLLGRKTGSALKDLVYETFDEEIRQKNLGQMIEA